MTLTRKQVFEIIDMVKTDLGMGDYEFRLATTDAKYIYSSSCGENCRSIMGVGEGFDNAYPNMNI